jgi:phosphoribosylglycinamide formyltransferase-1
MKKIVILFSGRGSNLLNLIEQLHHKACVVAAAITNRPEAAGIAKARAHGVHVDILDHTRFDSREAFDTELVKLIESHAPDLVVMAGFMRILSPAFFTLKAPAINIHPSLLPLFKGAKAIERNFESDEPLGGATVHWVTEELDSGGIVLQASFERTPGESFESFKKRVHDLEYTLFPRAVTQLLNPEE